MPRRADNTGCRHRTRGHMARADRLVPFAVTLALLLAGVTFAADLRWISPVNDRILLLFFDEGDRSFDTCGTCCMLKSCPLIWGSGPLDTDAADIAGNYTITSTDDTAYPPEGIAPEAVGKKIKPVAGDKAYWYYLKLPVEYALRSGKTYTVTTDTLAANTTGETFVFDEHALRSEAVHVNQIGFDPKAARKYAYVYQWMGTLDDYVNASLSYNEGQGHALPVQLELRSHVGRGLSARSVLRNQCAPPAARRH